MMESKAYNEKEMRKRKVYNVRDVKELLDIGYNKAYELMKCDSFPSFNIGNKWLVPIDKFDEWLMKQSKAGKW